LHSKDEQPEHEQNAAKQMRWTLSLFHAETLHEAMLEAHIDPPAVFSCVAFAALAIQYRML
jgi:hypothetical protein